MGSVPRPGEVAAGQEHGAGEPRGWALAGSLSRARRHQSLSSAP